MKEKSGPYRTAAEQKPDRWWLDWPIGHKVLVLWTGRWEKGTVTGYRCDSAIKRVRVKLDLPPDCMSGWQPTAEADSPTHLKVR